jgi:hypothetical protein
MQPPAKVNNSILMMQDATNKHYHQHQHQSYHPYHQEHRRNSSHSRSNAAVNESIGYHHHQRSLSISSASHKNDIVNLPRRRSPAAAAIPPRTPQMLSPPTPTTTAAAPIMNSISRSGSGNNTKLIVDQPLTAFLHRPSSEVNISTMLPPPPLPSPSPHHLQYHRFSPNQHQKHTKQ